MGRPPCCDKMGVKKGPWTPEEDIMLVTHVQQHGPGNWKNVPTITGLRRCSKSCRLRWANYLRPGIKRGSFSNQEEKKIIQLQALLGNKWAAIASYLPERTDNDIKNYWNTHLKKKLQKHHHQQQLQTCPDHHDDGNINGSSSSQSQHSISTSGQWEKTLQTDVNKAKQALNNALSMENNTPTVSVFSHSTNPSNQPCSSYASSIENIARLLKDWVKNPTKSEKSKSFNDSTTVSTSSNGLASEESKAAGIDLSEESFESLFGSNYNSQGESKPADLSTQVSLKMLENWLFDEGGGDNQGKDDMANFSFDDDDDQNMF